ncbi:hypothetical protein DL93DRAFT_2201017 [Clavulina sp. PMI_390]|nr:hypothetical protein DL93DRAFT_2201017 [Clavulina sp. PMI_390]
MAGELPSSMGHAQVSAISGGHSRTGSKPLTARNPTTATQSKLPVPAIAKPRLFNSPRAVASTSRRVPSASPTTPTDSPVYFSEIFVGKAVISSSTDLNPPHWAHGVQISGNDVSGDRYPFWISIYRCGNGDEKQRYEQMLAILADRRLLRHVEWAPPMITFQAVAPNIMAIITYSLGEDVYDVATLNTHPTTKERIYRAYEDLHRRGLLHGSPSLRNVLIERADPKAHANKEVKFFIMDYSRSRAVNLSKPIPPPTKDDRVEYPPLPLHDSVTIPTYRSIEAEFELRTVRFLLDRHGARAKEARAFVMEFAKLNSAEIMRQARLAAISRRHAAGSSSTSAGSLDPSRKEATSPIPSSSRHSSFNASSWADGLRSLLARDDTKIPPQCHEVRDLFNLDEIRVFDTRLDWMWTRAEVQQMMSLFNEAVALLKKKHPPSRSSSGPVHPRLAQGIQVWDLARKHFETHTRHESEDSEIVPYPAEFLAGSDVTAHSWSRNLPPIDDDVAWARFIWEDNYATGRSGPYYQGVYESEGAWERMMHEEHRKWSTWIGRNSMHGGIPKEWTTIPSPPYVPGELTRVVGLSQTKAAKEREPLHEETGGDTDPEDDEPAKPLLISRTRGQVERAHQSRSSTLTLTTSSMMSSGSLHVPSAPPQPLLSRRLSGQATSVTSESSFSSTLAGPSRQLPSRTLTDLRRPPVRMENMHTLLNDKKPIGYKNKGKAKEQLPIPPTTPYTRDQTSSVLRAPTTSTFPAPRASMIPTVSVKQSLSPFTSTLTPIAIPWALDNPPPHTPRPLPRSTSAPLPSPFYNLMHADSDTPDTGRSSQLASTSASIASLHAPSSPVSHTSLSLAQRTSQKRERPEDFDNPIPKKRPTQLPSTFPAVASLTDAQSPSPHMLTNSSPLRPKSAIPIRVEKKANVARDAANRMSGFGSASNPQKISQSFPSHTMEDIRIHHLTPMKPGTLEPQLPKPLLHAHPNHRDSPEAADMYVAKGFFIPTIRLTLEPPDLPSPLPGAKIGFTYDSEPNTNAFGPIGQNVTTIQANQHSRFVLHDRPPVPVAGDDKRAYLDFEYSSTNIARRTNLVSRPDVEAFQIPQSHKASAMTASMLETAGVPLRQPPAPFGEISVTEGRFVEELSPLADQAEKTVWNMLYPTPPVFDHRSGVPLAPIETSVPLLSQSSLGSARAATTHPPSSLTRLAMTKQKLMLTLNRRLLRLFFFMALRRDERDAQFYNAMPKLPKTRGRAKKIIAKNKASVRPHDRAALAAQRRQRELEKAFSLRSRMALRNMIEEHLIASRQLATEGYYPLPPFEVPEAYAPYAHEFIAEIFSTHPAFISIRSEHIWRPLASKGQTRHFHSTSPHQPYKYPSFFGFGEGILSSESCRLDEREDMEVQYLATLGWETLEDEDFFHRISKAYKNLKGDTSQLPRGKRKTMDEDVGDEYDGAKRNRFA